MDRFEARKITFWKKYAHIYIPVWIDLKPECVAPNLCERRYLHSSMDRFEGRFVYGIYVRRKTFTFQYG